MISTSDHGAGVIPTPVLPSSAIQTFGKKILVAMPWQKQLSPLTAFCVAQLMDRRRTASVLHWGDAFVAHSRNSVADAFLASDMEWLLTVDDDMIVPFGNADWFRENTGLKLPEKFMGFNALDRLMCHGKTLVGALYYGRHPNGKPMYNEGIRPEEIAFLNRGPHDGIKPTRWVATGCLLIHRKVFTDIEARFPALARRADGKGGNWFTSTEASLLHDITQLSNQLQGEPMTGELAYKALAGITAAIAKARHENPLGSGEDVSFCLRAATAGHQPYVDLGLRCGHIGHAIY